MTGPIDRYLDDLVRGLSTSRPRELRTLVAEADAHLRDAADAAAARGLSRDAAETEAVARFGPAAEVAAAERASWATPLTTVIRQFAANAVLLGGIGAVAVGLSGVIAAAIHAIGGSRVLVTQPTAADLTAANCARWLAGQPSGTACRTAAMRDWTGEIIWLRIAAGLLGLVALAVFAILRRRHRGARPLTLPPMVADTIGAGAFTVAGIWTLGLGIDAIAVSHGDGSGQWLSAAPIALAAATGFGVRLARDLRSHPATN